MILLKIIITAFTLIVFLSTAGGYFKEHYHSNKIFLSIAITIAILSTYFTVHTVVEVGKKQIIEEIKKEHKNIDKKEEVNQQTIKEDETLENNSNENIFLKDTSQKEASSQEVKSHINNKKTDKPFFTSKQKRKAAEIISGLSLIVLIPTVFFIVYLHIKNARGFFALYKDMLFYSYDHFKYKDRERFEVSVGIMMVSLIIHLISKQY